jgi:hypothetical protein
MAKSPKTKRMKPPKIILKLPDLEHSKSTVLSHSFLRADPQSTMHMVNPQKRAWDVK